MQMIKNRIKEFEDREKINKFIKYKPQEKSNVIHKSKEKLYEYYKCDYCGEEIRLDIKPEERSGGIVDFPHTLTKRGKIRLVLHNKCFKKAIEEFTEEEVTK